MRASVAVVVAVLLALAVPAPAYAAATVTSDADSINYLFTGGAVGEVVTVGTDSGQVYIDSEQGVTSSDCAQTIGTQVACDARPAIVLVLSPHGDRLNGGNIADGMRVDASGGDGADELIGSPNSDVIRGGNGDDELTGGAGDDTLDCGTGRDIAHAGPGDILKGCETVTGLPLVQPVYAFKVSAKNSEGVLVTKFKIRNLAAGDDLTVKCAGPTCPFKTKQPDVTGSKVKLVKLFKDERVGRVKVKILVERVDAIGALRTYKVSKQGEVSSKTKCLVPGTSRPTAC